MSLNDVAEKLALLRANLRDQDLDSAHRAQLERAVDALEAELAAHAGGSSFEDQVLAWEARFAVEHPVLANVLSDAVRKLSAMGI